MTEKKVYIILGFLLIATFFSFIIFTTNFTTTGFTIYSAQPDPTEGIDTYLRQESATNYGADGIIRGGTVSTAGGREFRTIIYFDLSSIPSSDTIVNANLSLYLITSYTSNNTNITLNAYRITSNWTENAASWYNRTSSSNWTTVGGDYDTEIISSTIITNETGWFNFTITNAIRNWVNGTNENYGLMLYAPDAEAGDYKDFASSDYTLDSSLRPQIRIDYTENAAPTINSISTNSINSSPTQTGNTVNFSIDWTDLENDNAQIYICNTSNITFSGGCEEKTFCSTSLSSTNPASCSYTVLATDNRTTSFWAAACDENNCSSVSEENFFYTNNPPTILLIQPNGGETVNQSQGNYSIKFNVTDSNSDTLIANIYYGTTQNSTSNTIDSNINLTSYCLDGDSDTATTNNCTYSWNSSGIYGAYFLTIIINDSYTTKTDSSDLSFDVRGIEDNLPPQITSQSIDSEIYSGKTIQINATITDEHTIETWVAFNYTSTNATMTNTSTTAFNTTFIAPAVGTYQYKIFAKDVVDNLNDSMDWQEFTVVKPNASPQNPQAPSTALPYSTIQITSQLNATDSLRNVYAYLNVPDGFIFLENYPQNSNVGNFTVNQTKTATWFVACPMTESTYTLNTTWTDGYSNSWNGSSFQITVTSAVGGEYTLEVTGYPEVETSDNYYTEGKFTQNAVYKDPDSITILIYDAGGSLIVGPASMTKESTGQYNYTYTVGASATEGQWETIINATKDSTSYYANEFWKVVGGPFDVRNITILDGEVEDLIINLTTENTGGANKDLTIVWNLTREDTGATLDSGSETFMVPALTIKPWTIYPTTSYVGQVRITILGYYSGTEKAGGYRIFSTTSNGTTPEEPPITPGGGGAGSAIIEKEKNYSIEIIDFERIIPLSKNLGKIITFTIQNTGKETITNIKAFLENFDEKYYTIILSPKNTLEPNEKTELKMEIKITDLIGEKDSVFKITSNEINLTKEITFKVLSMKEYFEEELAKLTDKLNNLRERLIGEEKEDLAEELDSCKTFLDNLRGDIEEEEFIDANNNIRGAEDCIKKVEDKALKERTIPFAGIKITDYWVWIVTWILILLLIIVIIIVIYILNKKLSILNYARQKQSSTQTPKPTSLEKRGLINEKLKDLKERLD